jgi:hypothetical protein
VDINKLSTPEKIIGVSGIVLFIASFLPWFTYSAGIYDFSANGWDTGFLWGGIPTLLGLVMVGHVVLSNFAENVKLPELPWPRVHMIAGIVAAALVVLKLLVGAKGGGVVTLDRGFGLILAAIAAIGLGVGGFLYYRESQGSTPAAM